MSEKFQLKNFSWNLKFGMSKKFQLKFELKCSASQISAEIWSSAWAKKFSWNLSWNVRHPASKFWAKNLSVRHPASEISGEISPEEIGRRITGAIGAGKSGEEGRLIRRQVPEVAAAAGGQFDSMLISVKPKRTFPPLINGRSDTKLFKFQNNDLLYSVITWYKYLQKAF